MSYGDGTVSWSGSRNRWVGRYERHDGAGNRKRGWVSAQTEAQAWRKLRKARSISAALPAYDERTRLDTYLRRWLDVHVSASVRPRTADFYRSVVETHIIPELGGHKLTGLRAPHVLEWRNRMLESAAPRSVSHRLTVLRAALAQAERWGMVERNVAALVPGPHVSTGEVRPLTTEQARTFLAAVKDDPLEVVYLLALTLGMRQGEILGLRWSDVEVERGAHLGDRQPGGHRAEDGRRLRSAGGNAGGVSAGVRLTIRKSLVWLHGQATLEDPKTERSRRTLDLPGRVAEALEARRGIQRGHRIGNKRWNPHWTEGYDLVFTDEDGYAIERTRITRAFQKRLAELGLPKVAFHTTRHTATGWLLELGLTMREVADILGHSKPSMTADVYSHLGGAATAKAARLMDEAL